MKKTKDFGSWLIDYWAEHDGCCVLDDDMPESFGDWLENIDPTDLIELGDKFAKFYHMQVMGNK